MTAFKSNEFTCLKELIGKQLDDIFLQPVAGLLSDVDMFVVNFGKNTNISLHIFSFFRVIRSGELLLTSTDCYFGKDYKGLTVEQEQGARQNCFENTLLQSNIANVKNILKKSYVTNAYSTDVGDVIIEFSNSVIMEIRIDALCHEYECYRLIVGQGEDNKHHVVTIMNGRLLYTVN